MSETDFNPANRKPHKWERMGKTKKRAVSVIISLIVALVYFYVKLPAINLHAMEFYGFFIFVFVVYFILTAIMEGTDIRSSPAEFWKLLKTQSKAALGIFAVLLIVVVGGSVLSSVVLRAGSYRELLQVETGNFATDVEEISFDKIPMVDRDSAERLGNRKLGELADMVSQFEVSPDYTQINYKGKPVRVTSLEYGDWIKWLNNRENGLPGYIVVDMVSQAAEVVRLQDGIKYSPSELFFRNLARHLRFSYPTYMFDTPTFEIDDDGHPYWICPKIEKTIGLFGGTDINGAVLVDAVTGESTYYADVPTWVDRVYSAELIIEQYDYHGQYVNGFFNSVFGQRDVTVTTDGYNYIALNDDVYMYTGITSVGTDQSNVGFILSNQRTKETKYYAIAGAEEYSAMSSAEGVVQHLSYEATFPLLLNISSQPTYFMALKDNAGLVKMYAMVNVQQYQIVATGSTVADCEAAYIKLLVQNNLATAEVLPVPTGTEKTGVVAEIRTAVLDGTSYYYLRFENESVFYVVSVADAPEAVIVSAGDTVTLETDSTGTGDLVSAYTLKRP